MTGFKVIAFVAVLLSFSFSAMADWIVLNGKTYQEVYIREGRSTYFIHFPETGEVMNVPRAGVQDTDVGILKDESRREALLAKWRETNPERERDAAHRRDVRRQAATAASTQPLTTHSEATGSISPQLQTRSYHVAETTLPKIVLRAPSVLMPAPRIPSGVPSGTAGGLGSRGMGMPGYNRPAMSGAGGQGGRFYRDVTAITNISDLFFNINDQMVGEPSPEILPSYLFPRRR